MYKTTIGCESQLNLYHREFRTLLKEMITKTELRLLVCDKTALFITFMTRQPKKTVFSNDLSYLRENLT